MPVARLVRRRRPVPLTRGGGHAREELAEHGKSYEFHTFAVQGTPFSPPIAVLSAPKRQKTGWEGHRDFFGRHLASEEEPMCTYQTARFEVRGSGQGVRPDGSPRRTPPSISTTRCTLPSEHSLERRLLQLHRCRSRPRVGVELDPASARALARAIDEMLDQVPAGLVGQSVLHLLHP